MPRHILILLVSLAALQLASVQARAADFPLKEGDIWVMAGDSLTAQHLHSNYFEAFCFARYPNLKFAFRNSGYGGDTIPTVLARFDYDIAGWKPTVVSVELGMNDHHSMPTDKFVANMGLDRAYPLDQGPPGHPLAQPDQPRQHHGQPQRQQTAA